MKRVTLDETDEVKCRIKSAIFDLMILPWGRV